MERNPVWSVLLMVIGELLIILDAALVGAMMNGYKIRTAEILVFWIFLIGGICLRYWAETLKK